MSLCSRSYPLVFTRLMFTTHFRCITGGVFWGARYIIFMSLCHAHTLLCSRVWCSRLTSGASQGGCFGAQDISLSCRCATLIPSCVQASDGHDSLQVHHRGGVFGAQDISLSCLCATLIPSCVHASDVRDSLQVYEKSVIVGKVVDLRVNRNTCHWFISCWTDKNPKIGWLSTLSLATIFISCGFLQYKIIVIHLAWGNLWFWSHLDVLSKDTCKTLILKQVDENNNLEKTTINHVRNEHTRTKTKNVRKFACSTYPILMMPWMPNPVRISVHCSSWTWTTCTGLGTSRPIRHMVQHNRQASKESLTKKKSFSHLIGSAGGFRFHNLRGRSRLFHAKERPAN